jgi:divalent metal cation (Fe/Co/Zn/Cd) transporter
VHRYNAQTFILRESLCATYEGENQNRVLGAAAAAIVALLVAVVFASRALLRRRRSKRSQVLS